MLWRRREATDTTLIITFNEAPQPGGYLPALGDFGVTVKDVDEGAFSREIEVTGVAIRDDTVTLTLASPVNPGDGHIIVHYVPQGDRDPARWLQDPIGNLVNPLRRGRK